MLTFVKSRVPTAAKVKEMKVKTKQAGAKATRKAKMKTLILAVKRRRQEVVIPTEQLSLSLTLNPMTLMIDSYRNGYMISKTFMRCYLM